MYISSIFFPFRFLFEKYKQKINSFIPDLARKSYSNCFIMLLTQLLPLALVGLTFASPLPQDATAPAVPLDPAGTIVASYDAIKGTIQDYAAAVQAITTELASPANLLAKSKALTAALQKGKADVEKTTTVDLLAALALAMPGEALTSSAEAFVNDLIAKKDVLVKAKQSEAVLKELKEQRDLAKAFTDAVNSKLDPLAGFVAQLSSGRPITALEKAITAFST